MSSNKIKLYRSAERRLVAERKLCVPQYQVLGIEPSEYKSAVLGPTNAPAKPQGSNPRGAVTVVRQPYASPSPSPLGRGKGPLPNVGNNVEHIWSSVDGEVVNDHSDVEIDPDHPFIDNNDVMDITDSQQYLPSDVVIEPPLIDRGTNSDESEIDAISIFNDLKEGEYLLIASGIPICSGPKDEIEDQAKALFFGDHEMCNGNPIPDSDIIILRKIPIKIGLFIE